MNPDPFQPATTGPDPLDETQPLDVPRYAPTPDPRPDARWAWASAEPGPPPGRWYEPAPAEPASAGVPWASGATATGGDPFASPGGLRPAFAGGGGADLPVAQRRRSRPGIGTIVTASLLSAVLASGATALALGQAGAFDRPAATAKPGIAQQPGAQPAGQSSSLDESSAVITSAAKVSPAVVKITTTGQASDPFGTTPAQGVGSGIIYDANGWIVTNRHVVNGADKLTVELKDGRQFDATVYGIDTLTDLAIVKVDATGLPTATIGNSDELKVGQLVVAVGSPLGIYSFSVTSGIVSGKGRKIQVGDGSTGTSSLSNLIQTDAAINPGNSGGPLADASGAVVGIDTAVATDSSGIGFAIPIDIAKPIMAQAVRGETLARPYIGVTFQSLTLQLQATLKLSVSEGALITPNTGSASAITPDSPAAKAGLKDGDVITAINGVSIDHEHPLDAMLVQYSPSDTIQLTVLRGGTTITVPLTLAVRPARIP